MKILQDLQLNEREFQTARALTLKALADNVRMVSDLSAGRHTIPVKSSPVITTCIFFYFTV